MVVQALLDSLSRCFGAPGSVGHHPGSVVGEPLNINANEVTTDNRRRNNRHVEEGDAQALRRRQGRALGLELHDQEWDALFDREVSPHNNDHSSNNNNNHKEENEDKCNSKMVPDMDVGYADVLAKAKEAAKPARHATPRKSAIDKKADIFRSKSVPNPSFASRLLGTDVVVKALCFANPVHDCSGTTNRGNDDILSQSNTYDNNTVNTAEDTITSTICFENKYNHQQETRPPMPLFNRYKVECNDWRDNVLLGIVSSGSHQSIHMLEEFQNHSEQNYPSLFSNVPVTPVADDILQDLDVSSYQPIQTQNSNNNKSSLTKYSISTHPFTEECPPPVQAISDSMSTAPSSPSTQSDNKQMSLLQNHKTECQSVSPHVYAI